MTARKGAETPRTDEVATGPAGTYGPLLDLARTLERELTAAREDAERVKGDLALLQDPVNVCVNMIRGTIAKPDIRSLLHVHGEAALLKWDNAEAAESRAAAAEAALKWRKVDDLDGSVTVLPFAVQAVIKARDGAMYRFDLPALPAAPAAAEGE